MPSKVYELYKKACNVFLSRVDRKERGDAASTAAGDELVGLVQAVFFQAHAAESRVIVHEHLQAAALGARRPSLRAFRTSLS